MKLAYSTGRDYGKPQVLHIELPDTTSVDDWALLPVQFYDAARGIIGTVQLFALEATPSDAGRAVLAAYDEGRYV